MTLPSRDEPAPRPSRLPELLAPAGSPEAFRAAVAAGADAVYLSGKRFGARKSATNFSDEEIAEAVRYAHAHDIRVYVTVNTLVHDRELGDVLGYLVWLYETGVDAVLVQDTGIALLARRLIPGLVLHASTQMTIHSAECVRRAAALGFSRVVLARELSLDAVARIAEATKDTGIGLEVFAHGALCYGYSGQCLLSSVIGGRSGNRGMCAQPCRKPYALVTGSTDAYGRPDKVREVPLEEPYLLSPKDLCTYRHLPDLVRSPVASLKIEGRMKSPEYVAIVVSTYRRALDAVARGTWHELPEEIFDLLLAFNRGFTEGYLFGDCGPALMGRDESGHRGLPVGTVTAFDRVRSVAAIRADVPVVPAPGDGLLFVPPPGGGDAWGMALNNKPVPAGTEYTLALPRPVLAGTRVAITSSRELEAKAHQMVAKPDPALLRPVPVDLSIEIVTDGGIRAEGTILRRSGPPIPFSFQPEVRLEPARAHPLTAAQLEQQFRKTGGTPFAIRQFSLRYPGSFFAPLAVINALRRDLFRSAEEILIGAGIPDPSRAGQVREDVARYFAGAAARTAGSGNTPGARMPLLLSVWTDTLGGVREAAAAGTEVICYEPEIVSDTHQCIPSVPDEPFPACVKTAREIAGSYGARLVFKLPRITHDDLLATVIPALPDLCATGLADCMTDSYGAADALVRAVPGLSLHGSTGLNIFNHVAAEGAGPGFTTLVLSPELSRDDIRELVQSLPRDHPHPSLTLVVQGANEAMITEDCILRLLHACGNFPAGSPGTGVPFTGIRDETGHIFPIRSDGRCCTRISNAMELCLIDHLPAIRDLGVMGIIVDARGRPPVYTREMTAIYRAAAGIASAGGDPGACSRELAILKDRVKAIALGGITAGHFLRGLLE